MRSKQQSKRRLIKADDIQDDFRRTGWLSRPLGDGGITVAVHRTDRLIVVLADLHSADGRAAPVGAERAGLDDGEMSGSTS